MMDAAQDETRAVFTATLARNTPEERARYLDQVSRDKPELRQRVEQLLRAHEEAGRFLEIKETEPKAIDFGVAKALGQKLTEKTLFTSSGGDGANPCVGLIQGSDGAFCGNTS